MKCWQSIQRLGFRNFQGLSHVRAFHRSAFLQNESGSLFSDVGTASNVSQQSTPAGASKPSLKKPESFLQDPELQKIIGTSQTAAEKLLSPLKRQLYEKALQTGGYEKNKVVQLDDGQKYILNLTKQELEALEPSLYLKSYRIKGSYKKATPFLRMLSGLPLKKAITQCHFASKTMARDVGEMLTRGLEDAKALKLDADDLYLQQIWVGKDPLRIKRIDFKGRGRMGIITHKWIHVRAILKTSVTKERIANDAQKRQANRKVHEQLHSTPFHNKKASTYNW